MLSRGRPIEDVDQARHVVDGGKASFVELLECAEIGKSADDWQLRRDAAERAVNLVVGDKRQIASVHLAAQHLAAAILGEASDLDDLDRYVAAVRRRVSYGVGRSRQHDGTSELRGGVSNNII